MTCKYANKINCCKNKCQLPKNEGLVLSKHNCKPEKCKYYKEKEG